MIFIYFVISSKLGTKFSMCCYMTKGVSIKNATHIFLYNVSLTRNFLKKIGTRNFIKNSEFFLHISSELVT